MTMKRFFIAVLAISALLISCSLEEDPQGYVTKETFYNTEDQCYSALRACYTPIHYIYNRDFLFATEACTDIWYCYTSNENGQLAINPAKSGVALTVWKYAYKGIARANECVECISQSPLKESVKMPMVAEARAMRALYYYILTCFMGDVPFYMESVKDIETMDAIRALPRKPAEEIRSILYQDLKENALPYFTEENGLKCRANEVKNQHSGYALTLMMMGKFAMWNNQWEDALYALDLLAETYKEFTEERFPLEEVQWRYKNVNESIFEIRHEWSSNGVQFSGNIAPVMGPSCAGEYLYDGVYMPELSRTGSSSTPLRATKHYALFRSANNKKEENSSNALGIFPAMPMYLTNETYLFEGKTNRYCSEIDMNALENGQTANGSALDKRIVYTFGLGNLKSGETFTSLRTGGMFYAGPKFWCPGMTATYDSNNYRILRYADAVLMQAECHYELSNPERSLHYLNQVRKRAGLEDYQYVTDAELIREIQNERARELGGEFHRKFDLVRWGIWYDMTKQFNEESRVKSNIRRCHRYYPIPDTECALSNGVLSNPEYDE